MNAIIRRALTSELDTLLHIESQSFPEFQRSSRRALKWSLESSSQEVYVLEDANDFERILGCLILLFYKKTIRIYSIAVLPELHGKGYGRQLLNHAEHIAFSRGFERISLEAFVDNKPLINWYKKAGFESVELIDHFYAGGLSALRMTKLVQSEATQKGLQNLLIVDHPEKWPFSFPNVELVSAKSYTADLNRFSKRNFRVFNLCESYRYQSLGYYVSLLANAREHRVIPSVTALRDTKDFSVIQTLAEEIDETIQRELKKEQQDSLSLDIYFGSTRNPKLRKIGQKIFRMFEIPLLNVEFVKKQEWQIKKVTPLSIAKLSVLDFSFLEESARTYFETQRFQRQQLKNYAYDMAILVNPDEEHPPSNKKALQLFKEIGNEEGFYVEFITRSDVHRISEFDALFLRETTHVNTHTYKISRKAYAEGLVVMDDPWAILKCSNKIFLNERLRNNGLEIPETNVLFKGEQPPINFEKFNFPLILKQPDSAFSLGVVKVNNPAEMKEKVGEMFRKSDLILTQKFMPSAFDWRIGVLDNQPLFACKYYMASGHWQIYDWKSGEEDPSGDADTISVTDVPKKVMRTALKAASLIGDGLFGVDLKEIEGKVYVIEVNDNPNIDFGIEDHVLGKELYRIILKSFKHRIELARNITRFVNIEPK